ncbi:MAG: hypothetical protein GF347_03125 [Candidatus Moranbacteria bacterium]|nr:hypothetical protein [Candidatus Moranbacteria bacterium]
MATFLMQLSKHGLIFSAMLLLFLTLSCENQADLPDDLVAQVNDHYLLEEQLNYSVPQDLGQELSLSLKKSIITEWVNRDLLYQAAQKENLALSAKNAFLVNQYEKSLLVQQYLEQNIDRSFNISQKDIEDYYDEHRQEFLRHEDEVHLIHLMMEQRDNAIFSEIRRADDLMTIVKKYYFDEKSTDLRPNGDLGYVTTSELPDNFINRIRRMRIGDISPVIKSDFGYHFLQLMDKKEKSSVRSLELVKNAIVLRLQKERYENEVKRLLDDLRKEYQIQTYFSKIQD